MKQEALEVLYNRRAIRKFKPEQIKDEELDAVLKAGTYAPTGMGLQSPLIVSVQNPDDVAKLNELSAAILEKGAGVKRPGLPYYGAPTIILIFYTEIAKSDYFGILDSSAVCTNMLNAAYAVGLGSCWIHRCKEIFELEEGKALLRKWGINEKVVGVASIALGYSDMEQPLPKPRRDGYVIKIK
jgi:nitroreductase